MTTFAWIILIILILSVSLIIYIVRDINDDAVFPIGALIIISLTGSFMLGLIIMQQVDIKDTQEQYHPKTKVTITSDSTYHVDTLYYIKVKPKIK